MAEINSRQAAKIAANKKVAPNEIYGKKRIVVIGTPATHALAQGDTIASGVRLPVGTRFTLGSRVSNAAMGTSVTIDVGIRNADTKVAIDADGIAAAVAVATAGRSALDNGAFIAAGAEYVTDQPSELYVTIGGAAPTASAQLRVEVELVSAD